MQSRTESLQRPVQMAARTVRVPVGQVTDGSCESPAWGRTGRVAPDEGGDIRIKLGTNGYEGKGGALTY